MPKPGPTYGDSPRDRAVVQITRLLEAFDPRREWRHTEVAEVVDTLIEAARAPESAHSRELAEETTRRASEAGARFLRDVE